MVESTKVNVRPVLRGERSVSSAARRTILRRNNPFLPAPIKFRSPWKGVSCLFSKLSKLFLTKVWIWILWRWKYQVGTSYDSRLIPERIVTFCLWGICFELNQVTPTKSSIVSYHGGSIPVLGTRKLQVWRGSFTCLLLCRPVKSKCCRPILGKSACKGTGVVEIKDSDAIRQPDTRGVNCFLSRIGYLVPILSPRSMRRSKRYFPMCSTKALVYHIQLSDSAKPIQLAPRRGQVALRGKINPRLGGHWTSLKANALDLIYVSHPEKECEHKNMSAPEPGIRCTRLKLKLTNQSSVRGANWVFLRHKEKGPRERGCRLFSRASCLYSFTSNVTPVIRVRFTFIRINAGKQVLISIQF